MSVELATRVAYMADTYKLSVTGLAYREHLLKAAGINPASLTKEVLAQAKVIFDGIEGAAEAARQVARRYPNYLTEGQPPRVKVEASVEGAAAGDAPVVVKEKRTVCRLNWNGYSVTAVLRWMGANKWSFDDAAQAVLSMGGKELSDTTIRIQLKAGKDGTRGPAAPITAAQAKALQKLSQ